MEIDQQFLNELTKLIKDPQERAKVCELLENWNPENAGQKSLIGGISKRARAKKALAIITRIGLEMGKHELFDWFFRHFD